MQNRKRIFAFVVIVACTLSWSFSNAQEPSPGQTPSPSPTSISPDKKWEYRVEDDDSAVLVRSDREKPVIKLSDPENDGSLKTKTGKLIWAPDSKRFAFNYRAGSRYNTTALYQLHGDKWVALRSPQTGETRQTLERVMAAQLRKLGLPPKTYRQRLSDITRVREWVGPDTAILYRSSSAAVPPKNESDERNILGADFLFTLKFDEAGNWKIVKTHQMSKKELEGEQ